MFFFCKHLSVWKVHEYFRERVGSQDVVADFTGWGGNPLGATGMLFRILYPCMLEMESYVSWKADFPWVGGNPPCW